MLLLLTARLHAIVQDVQYAFRALRHSPALTCWVVGSLAIGMAVNIAALAFLNASLVAPFPQITRQDRLVRIAMSRNCGRPDCWTRMASPSDYEALRHGLGDLEGLAAYTIGDVAVSLPQARSARGAFASGNYFDVLGVHPASGRLLHPADDATYAAVAVISHGLWARELDSDPNVIGRSIQVADRFVEIVGVAPELFMGIDRDRPGAPRSMEGGGAPDLWLPLWMAETVLPPTIGEQQRQERAFSFVGRLRDGAGLSAVQAQASVVAFQLAAARGQEEQHARAEVLRVWRVNPRNWHFGIIIVMPIPILVLAIACVNAANLMLARGSQRQREIAIRLALGASRFRVVRELLLESGLLALCATIIGLGIAWWALQLASTPLNLPVTVDPLVVMLTLLTAAATTLAFGLAPAIRVSAQQPSSTLGSGTSRTDAVPRQSRMRRLLLVAQVALSLGLLATAWQLVSTVRAQAVSSGTPPHRLLIARFNLEPLKFSAADAESFYGELLARTVRVSGVEAAGVARHTAIWTFGRGAGPASLLIWRPGDKPEEGHVTIGGYAGGNLFEAVGLRLVAGRYFTDADRQARPQVVLVNETAARQLDGPAVGSAIRVAPRRGDFASSVEVRIVGVVEAAVEPRLEQGGSPAAKVYLPSPIEPEPALALYVRTYDDAVAVAQPVREVISRLAPRVPILEIGSLEELNERSFATQLWLARAAGLLGIIGLLLATAGLYGVASYVVTMRSREIAIRMAIGAQPRAILTMILGQSMRTAGMGLAVGGSGAIVVSRFIQSEYHGIQGIDAAAFAGAAALFLAAMLLAGAVPAVRASRLNPIQDLKEG